MTPTENTKADRQFAVILSLIFLAAAIFNVYHHVMWRDEIRAWQIAAASPTLTDLHENLKYEGTPILWYLLVWPLTKMTANPFAMQLLHVVIAAAVVFTFAFLSPFERRIKALFAFGYFPFFEYATITRSYGLVFLLVLLATAIIARQKARPILLSLVLALLTQCSLWGIGLAGLLMGVALLRWVVLERSALRGSLVAWAVSLLVVIGMGVLAYLQVQPGPGKSFLMTWHDATTADKWMGSIGTAWKGWMPIPQFQRIFWNINILDDYYITQFLLACLLLVIMILSLLRSPAALFLFVFGLGGMMTFTFLKFCGVTRHHGQLFMVLIAACWLVGESPRWTPPTRILRFISGWFDEYRNLLLTMLLAVHAVIGIGCNFVSIWLPFSASKQAADYIRQNVPADVLLVGLQDYSMSSIIGYLGRPFYFPQMHAFGTFNTQDDKHRYPVEAEDIFRAIAKLSGNSRDALLVISVPFTFDRDDFDYPVAASSDSPGATMHVKVIAEFGDSTVPDEAYILYHVHKLDPLTPTTQPTPVPMPMPMPMTAPMTQQAPPSVPPTSGR